MTSMNKITVLSRFCQICAQAIGEGKEKKKHGIVVRVGRKDGIWCNIDNMYVSEGILGLVNWGVGEIYVSS